MTTPRRAALASAIALITALVLSPVLDCGVFPSDDDRYLAGTYRAASLPAREAARWILTSDDWEFWFPATRLSLIADARLSGREPRAFHRTNLILHAASAALLFLLLVELGASSAAAAAAALLFALHPLRVETVAWIAERKGVLNGALTIAALLAYARHARRPSAARLWAAFTLFALSLTAKPSSLSLPLALLVLDAVPFARHRRESWAALAREKWAFWLAAAGAAAVTRSAQAPTIRAGESLPLAARGADALVAIWTGLVKVVRPEPSSLFESTAGVLRWPDLSAPALLIAGLALAAAAAAAWRARRAAPELGAGLLIYAVLFLPVLGGLRGLYSVLPDRYTYLPHLGLAWIVAALLTRAPRPLPAAAAALLLAGFEAGAARAAIVPWTSPIAFCEHMLARRPESLWARNELGMRLLMAARFEEARAQLERVVASSPGHPYALNGLAFERASRGDAPGALRLLAAARRERARELLELNEALLLARAGRRGAAAALARRGLAAREPYASQARLLLAALDEGGDAPRRVPLLLESEPF